MDILRRLRDLESTVARTMDGAAQKMRRGDTREPLEILHAVVERVENRIEPAGRGAHVFPFDRIRVVVVAVSNDARARFDAVFGSEPTLHGRIVERLQGAGCALTDLCVETTYVESSDPNWTTPHFNVEFERTADPSQLSLQDARPPILKLAVVHGVAEQPAYAFTATRINLGRCAEVRDRRNHLIRTNHVAFGDSAEGPNFTISRQHAHIDYTADPIEYRLCDDQSAHGTCIVRRGQSIPIPPGPRGVRLASGDAIMLGEARLDVDVAEE